MHGPPRYRSPAVAKDKEKPGETLIAKNRRASYDYELTERYEAGIVLMGSEVKMLRRGKADLTDAWCAIEQDEAFLRGMNIPVMESAAFGHEAKRARKLLLHEREISDLKSSVSREGMTIIVTRIYFKDGRVKAELALARGKKTEDKRESVKARDAEREARAAIARGRRGE